MLEPALLDDARLDRDQRELLETTDRLLEAIRAGDANTYASLCVPDLSCFEDVCAHRLDGLQFHLHLVRRACHRRCTRELRSINAITDGSTGPP